MSAPIACVGCSRTAESTGEYSEDNPVQKDGTYADGKFVCTTCYVKLIPLGLDVGKPLVIQDRIKNLVKK